MMVMTRTVARMSRAKLGAAMQKWRAEVRAGREAAREQERAAGLMVRTMCRMLAAQLAAGWRGWRAEVQRQLREEKEWVRGVTVMEGTARRILAAQLAAGFRAWSHAVDMGRHRSRAAVRFPKREGPPLPFVY